MLKSGIEYWDQIHSSPQQFREKWWTRTWSDPHYRTHPRYPGTVKVWKYGLDLGKPVWLCLTINHFNSFWKRKWAGKMRGQKIHELQSEMSSSGMASVTVDVSPKVMGTYGNERNKHKKNNWLVVWNPSEKYESQLGWWNSQYMGKKIDVPNHQPAIDVVLKCLFLWVVLLDASLSREFWTKCFQHHGRYQLIIPIDKILHIWDVVKVARTSCLTVSLMKLSHWCILFRDLCISPLSAPCWNCGEHHSSIKISLSHLLIIIYGLWSGNLKLVCGFNPPEKYSSVGIIIPNIWKNMKK